MPTYQYACTECGNHLEAVQSFSDAALTECPACHGKLRKVFNSVGIVFKGSGFYRNDSRATGASKESAPSDGSATPAADKKPAEKKTESTTSAPAATPSSTTSSSSTAA